MKRAYSIYILLFSCSYIGLVESQLEECPEENVDLVGNTIATMEDAQDYKSCGELW